MPTYLWKWVGISVSPTHFSFLPFPPRFHLQTVRLENDGIVGLLVVDIRIRTHPIRRIPPTLRHRPQIRRSLPSVWCLRRLLVETAAGISALPPGCW